MGDENKNEPKKNSDKINEPNPATNEYVDEPVDNKPQTNSKTINDCQVNKEPIKVIVNADQKDGWTIANRISIFGAAVSLILAVFTYLLFTKTIEANKTSTDALAESKRANDISQKALEDSRVNQNEEKERQKSIDLSNKTKFESDSKRDSINTKLAQQSLQGQMNAINDTRKRFELESRAFLQVSDVKVDTTNLRTPFNVTFIIGNTGKFPARIYFRSTTVISESKFLTSNELSKEIDKTGFKNEGMNEVISSNNVIMPIGLPLRGMSELEEKDFKSGKLAITILVRVDYVSLGIERRYSLRFAMRITRRPEINQLDFKSPYYSNDEIESK